MRQEIDRKEKSVCPYCGAKNKLIEVFWQRCWNCRKEFASRPKTRQMRLEEFGLQT